MNRFECTDSSCGWKGDGSEVQWIPTHEFYNVDPKEYPDGHFTNACPKCNRRAFDNAND